MFVGPSKGTPNIRSLYRNILTSSTAFFIAWKTEPKVLVSTVFCFSLNHMIGALLQNISLPVCNLLVAL
jgi:hypothetical protein